MDASAQGSEMREVFVGLSKLWWLWLVFGFIWIVIALVILQFDQASITTVGVLIGAIFLATGVQQFVIAGMVDGLIRWVLVFFGVLLVIAGVLSLISPENTFAGIADMLGFLFLIVGIFWIVQAFGERGANDFWWFGLISGVAMIVLAFWTGGQFFIQRAYVLLVFAGIWALFQGVNDIFRAFQIRAMGKAAEEIPPPPPPTAPAV
jgi:uncharacterized membrane protein HdeD (DUF308 family)